jgi:hypothetical protein
MIGSVDLGMAVQATSIQYPRGIGTGRNGLVPSLDMALLAKHRGFDFNQCCVIRPVSVMAVQTAFLGRGMFPQERPSLFAVAFQTRVVDRDLSAEPLAKRAMRAVAV